MKCQTILYVKNKKNFRNGLSENLVHSAKCKGGTRQQVTCSQWWAGPIAQSVASLTGDPGVTSSHPSSALLLSWRLIMK